ncbi:MAG: spore coat U domain-containing protein [Pseudomonadota bacterium]
MLAIARLALIPLLLAALPAWAACQLSLDAVNFGVIDTRKLELSNGRVRVDCDTPTSFAVGISGNNNGRKMRGPDGAEMDYQLYPNATYSRPWGDADSSGDVVQAQSDGSAPVDLTIYGLIPPQNFIIPGEYRDQPMVTLSF